MQALKQDKRPAETSEKTGPQKLLWQFRYSVIPFQPFDTFDMSLRTALAVTAVVAVLLYADTAWVAKNLPFLFIGLIIMYSLSIIPVVSGQISLGISHLCGIWFAVLLAWLVILILTPPTEMEEYEDFNAGLAALSQLDIPCNCSSICRRILAAISAQSGMAPAPAPSPPGSPAPAPPPPLPGSVLMGEVGDVNEVALGFLVFIVTFLIALFGTNDLWVLGAAVFFNIFVADWYSSMIDPSREIVEANDFMKQSRSVTFAVCFLLVAFMLPFPKFAPTFIPQPRLAFPSLFLGVGKLGNDVAAIYSRLVDKYKKLLRKDPDAKTDVSFINIQSRLNALQATVMKLRMGMFVGGRWEPYILPLPIPYLALGKNLAEYMVKLKILGVRLESLNRSTYLCPELASELQDDSLCGSLDESVNVVSRVLENDQDWGKCCGLPGMKNAEQYQHDKQELIDLDERLRNASFDVIALARQHLAQMPSPTDGVNDEEDIKSRRSLVKSAGFHCFYLYTVVSICHLVRDMTKLSNEPDSPKTWCMWVIDWPLRLFMWFGEWVMYWIGQIRDVIEVCLPKKFRRARSKRRSPGRRFLAFWRYRWVRVAGSLQYAAAALVASLWYLVTDLREVMPLSSTIVVSALVLIDRNKPGQGIRKGMLRALGTIFGIATAYFIAVEWGTDLSIIISLAIFAFIGRYLMANAAIGYAAQIFVATNFIILLSAEIDPRRTVNFVALRAVAVAIGVVIATLFTFLWPIKADRGLRGVMFGTLRNLSWHLEDTMTLSTKVTHDEWIDGIKEVDNSLNVQEELLLTAAFEPHLLRTDPFPQASYRAIKETESVLFHAIINLTSLLRHERFDDMKDVLQGPRKEKWDHMAGSIGKAMRSVAQKVLKEIPLDALHSKELQEELDDLYAAIQPFNMINNSAEEEAVVAVAVLYALQSVVDALREQELAVHTMGSTVRANAPPGIPIGKILTGAEPPL